MKLDEIQDIEILRKTLKATMCKCIKEIEIKGFGKDEPIKANKDEWYFYEHDEESEDYAYTIYDGKGNYGYISKDSFEMYFYTECHVENGKWKIF